MNMKMEEEFKKRALYEESNNLNVNIKKEDGDNKEIVFPSNMMSSIPNLFPNLNEMALPNVLRNLMFTNKIGAPF